MIKFFATLTPCLCLASRVFFMILLFSQTKGHLHAPAPKGVGQAGSVCDRPQAGIAVSALKPLVKQDETVIPIEHQVTRGNTVWPPGVCWQCI